MFSNAAGHFIAALENTDAGDEVARGNRSDCKPEIADLAKVEAARRYTTYSDVGNIGTMHIE